MPLRPLAKRLVAGLVVASLMFQAALLAAQFSLLSAAKADAAAALPVGIICTDHGIASLPSDEAPADPSSACAFCPWCATSAARQIAVLPATGFNLVEGRAGKIVFHFSADRPTGEHSAQPRSRGPPASA
jgi:hypothetical protein